MKMTPKRIIINLHHKFVFSRRVEIIAEIISQIIPANTKILDIGCGDGTISKMIANRVEGIYYEGIDIAERPTCAIPFTKYNGINMPFEANAFNAVQFIDVLHHTTNVNELVNSALQKADTYFIVKDHICNNHFDFFILKIMDWIGNVPHGVNLEYNFKPESYWLSFFEKLNLEILYYNNSLPLYSQPFNLIFGRKLHFIALLKKPNTNFTNDKTEDAPVKAASIY
ncbi:MAG: class I SAM-dependent methyltransferase [Prolixibacteraceae bacterium]|jgi:SAM-dependent methyltransferase|nr:class I SAM-dependent methyltransferase [Prolixibacteraceae bacterium]